MKVLFWRSVIGVLSLGVFLIAACGAGAPAAPVDPAAAPAATVALSRLGDGVVQAQSAVADTPALPFYGMEYVSIEELPRMRELGIDMVLADFSSEDDPAVWTAYLDAAQREGIRVVPWLWPQQWSFDRRTEEWTITPIGELYLRTVADHPALFAVYGLHEAYWNLCETCGYNTAQQQKLYRAIKAVVDVPIYSEPNGVSRYLYKGPSYMIADGMCDYCQAAFYPFLNNGEYQRDELIAFMEQEIALYNQYAPNSRLIWTIPVFAFPPDNLRMPTAEEMIDYAQIVYSRPEIYGAWWYVWRWDEPDYYPDFLANRPELIPVVRTIADTIVSERRATAPVPRPTATPIPKPSQQLEPAAYLPLVIHANRLNYVGRR